MPQRERQQVDVQTLHSSGRPIPQIICSEALSSLADP